MLQYDISVEFETRGHPDKAGVVLSHSSCGETVAEYLEPDLQDLNSWAKDHARTCSAAERKKTADKEMKNGHIAEQCPYATNAQRFGDKGPVWIHGPCHPEDAVPNDITEDDFEHLVTHKAGGHERDEDKQYNCPVCRFEVERWRQEAMTVLTSSSYIHPPNPKEGTHWYDEQTGKRFVWYGDKWMECIADRRPEDEVPAWFDKGE